MAGNEARFTPFGITDILKTQGQETCSSAQRKLAGELCTETQNAKEDTNSPDTCLDCSSEDAKTHERPRQTQGKVSKLVYRI